MRNNAILIVLLLFLVATLFFWFQVLRIKDLPPGRSVSPPVAVTPAEAEAFIKLAQELLIDYEEPMLRLYGRDPFARQELEIQPKTRPIEPSEKFIVSSIIYSDTNALVVINGEIMAEGDTIYDQEIGSVFMIENIEADRVEINDGESKYTLEMPLAAD